MNSGSQNIIHILVGLEHRGKVRMTKDELKVMMGRMGRTGLNSAPETMM